MIDSVSVGGRHEAHHSGFTDDRRYLWAGGLDDSRIHVFDVGSNPAQIKTKLQQSADDLGQPGTDPAYGKGRVNAYNAVTY